MKPAITVPIINRRGNHRGIFFGCAIFRVTPGVLVGLLYVRGALPSGSGPQQKGESS